MQKKINAPKNNIQTIQNNEEPKMPRDSIRSKNSKTNNGKNINSTHLPKVESSSSYQLLGNNNLDLKEQIQSNNFNYNLENIGNIGEQYLSNTNYNIIIPNMNDYDFNQQYNNYNNEISNNISYK